MGEILEITIFGSLVLISFLLISNPFKVNQKANLYLGLFTLLWSTFWFEELVIVANEALLVRDHPILSFINFLVPIPFYISVRYFTNPNYLLTKRCLRYLVLPLVYILVLIVPENEFVNMEVLKIALLFIHIFYYLTASYFLLRSHQLRIKQFASNTIEINLNWLEYIIAVVLSLSLMTLGFNIIFQEDSLNFFMDAVILLLVFFFAYNSMRQKEVFPLDEYTRKEILDADTDYGAIPKRKVISDERLLELKSMLKQLMMSNEPYLESDLTLSALAKQLGITSNQLSYVINHGFDANFYAYINTFRIDKAKQVLSDKKYDHLSIVGVAFESGFSSKTSFNTIFKKMTGLTPSEYKKKGSHL